MKRFIFLLVGVCVLFTVLFFVATEVLHFDDAYFQARLEELRHSPHGSWLAAAAIIGLLLGDLLLPIPSSLVMALSGMYYGTLSGALVAFAGSMACVCAGFGICRAGGHAYMERFLGKQDLQRISDWFEKYGVALILVSRPVPMLAEVLSCVAGLSDLRVRTFLIASAVGHFPVCLLYAYLGSRGSLSDPWPLVAAGLGIPGVFFLIFKRVHGRAATE
jgi:uncharacterized membrane protein YdjX (TVP38/TMEM64 family)